MNGGHYTAFVRLDSGTDIDFDDIHLPHQDFKEKVIFINFCFVLFFYLLF